MSIIIIIIFTIFLHYLLHLSSCEFFHKTLVIVNNYTYIITLFFPSSYHSLLLTYYSLLLVVASPTLSSSLGLPYCLFLSLARSLYTLLSWSLRASLFLAPLPLALSTCTSTRPRVSTSALPSPCEFFHKTATSLVNYFTRRPLFFLIPPSSQW